MSSALATLAEAFDSLRIPFLIGGSLAYSAHGVLRATLDVDILAAAAAGQAMPSTGGAACALGTAVCPVRPRASPRC
jgi:hypothetical protein